MNLHSLIDFVLDYYLLERLGIILALLILSQIIMALFRRFLRRAEKRGLDSAALPLLTSLVKYSLYVLVLLLALNVLGVNTAGLIAMIGAASLAIGLALKDTLSNIASGLLLLCLRPFRASDYIECGNIKGTIVGISLFNTTLKTLDGLYVSAPNSGLWGAPIVNFSRNPMRRLEVGFGISYSASVEKATAILKEVVENEPRFLKEPEPQYFVASLDDSSVGVTFRAWVNTKDYADLSRECKAVVKQKFDEAGIEIPFPQCVVHLNK